MGTYWYVDDPESNDGVLPVYEDDFVVAILAIARKRGVRITDKMIVAEIKRKWKTHGKKKSATKA